MLHRSANKQQVCMYVPTCRVKRFSSFLTGIRNFRLKSGSLDTYLLFATSVGYLSQFQVEVDPWRMYQFQCRGYPLLKIHLDQKITATKWTRWNHLWRFCQPFHSSSHYFLTQPQLTYSHLSCHLQRSAFNRIDLQPQLNCKEDTLVQLTFIFLFSAYQLLTFSGRSTS